MTRQVKINIEPEHNTIELSGLDVEGDMIILEANELTCLIHGLLQAKDQLNLANAQAIVDYMDGLIE